MTYPRGDARVNPCISPVTLLGMRLSKVAAKVGTKKKKGDACLSFRRWLLLPSEEALSYHVTFEFPVDEPFETCDERDLHLVNQPTAINKMCGSKGGRISMLAKTNLSFLVRWDNISCKTSFQNYRKYI